MESKISSILRKIKSFLIGLKHLIYIIVTKKNNECYIIMSTSIGDDVYGMAYLKDFKERKQKKIIIYVHERKTKLIENYGVADEIRSFSPRRPSGWVRINYFPFLINLGKKFGVYSIMPYHYIPLEKNDGRDCLRIIRESMLSIGDDVTIQFPDFNNESILSIPNIDQNREHIVILNYASQFVTNVDINLFQFIADDLSSNGFLVYSNVIGSQEPLKNTLPLRCSFYELFAISNKVRAVISVRSGILDLCANTNAAFLIYSFPFVGKNESYNQEWMNRYRVSAWGKKNLMENMCYNTEEGVKYYEHFKKVYLQHN